MKKVIYFTAGAITTVDEAADIAKLNAATLPQYGVTVMNGKASPNYGAGPAPADYVAGTIPTAYNAVETIDPDSIPNQALTDTQAIVNDGDAFTTEVSGVFVDTATVTVVDGVVTAIVLS